jgi:arsenite-transporting ATPase
MPDTGRWWFDRLFPIGKQATMVLAPLARPFLEDVPLPDRDTLKAAESLFEQLGDLYKLLSNPDLCSARLVVNPEKMVIKEAQRTYTYLSLYGYVTDAVICNRIFPETGDPYFATWRRTQDRYLEMIEQAFSPLPILKIPFFEQEVVGMDGLRRMADAIFGEDDPARLLYSGKSHSVTKSDEGYILSLTLPFTKPADVSLLRSGDELTVQIGNWRRNLVLPRALQHLEVGKAKFSDNSLNILFFEKVKA